MKEITKAKKHGTVLVWVKAVFCCSWVVVILCPTHFVGAAGTAGETPVAPGRFFSASVAGFCFRQGRGCMLDQTDEQCARAKVQKLSLPLCRDIEPSPRPLSILRGQSNRRPVITAPKPYIYDTVNGHKVCNKKNDKPSKSKKYKRIHMDMECCLDPDEIPNPHCYYDPVKYGTLLQRKYR